MIEEYSQECIHVLPSDGNLDFVLAGDSNIFPVCDVPGTGRWCDLYYLSKQKSVL